MIAEALVDPVDKRLRCVWSRAGTSEVA